MGPIDHFSIHRQDACVGLRGECVDDRLGVGDFFGGRGECGVDRADLRGVDGKLSGKAFGRRSAGFAGQSGLVAEVSEHAVDRLHLGRHRSRQTERAGQPVGECQLAVGDIFGRCAKGGGKSSAPQLIAARLDAALR